MVRLAPILNATKTARPMRSFLLFLAMIAGFRLIDIPLSEAFSRALPMLTVCLAGFCINDIFDQEQDRINHPERSLARFPALVGSVTTIYVCLFVTSVLLISLQDSPTERFAWSLFFILLSNYNFFKRTFPLIKNWFVAGAACLPVAILDFARDGQIADFLNYLPFFCIVFARELSCDIPDIEGDIGTLAKKLSKKYSVWLSNVIYIAAILLMFGLSSERLHIMALVSGAGSFTLYSVARTALGWPEKSLFIFSGSMAASAAVLIIS